MIFSSAVFIWVFLPIVFCVNYVLKDKYSNYFLLIASLIFYAYGGVGYSLIIVGSIFVNWLIGLIINKIDYKRSVLCIGVIINLASLFFFKYFNFTAKSINLISGKNTIPFFDIVLPIGISFFTFQGISYIVDIYRGEAEPSKSVWNTGLYISFFPQLIAGPIVKYRDIYNQIQSRILSLTQVSDGFRRFIYGLSKKVLISNVLGEYVDNIYAMDISTIGTRMAWAAALGYSFQIYFDFSGYSDMAIGLAELFGFKLKENFAYPYLSGSISEFWRRWHISLGTFFKEYLYIPLGGNRKGIARTCLNLMIVFLMTGIWHGANYTFILWGLFHGTFCVLEKLFYGEKVSQRRILSRIYCFFVVNLGWVFFRSNSILQALMMIKRMFMPWKYSVLDLPLWRYMDHKCLFMVAVAAIGSGWGQHIIPNSIKEMFRNSLAEMILCCMLFILSISSTAANAYNPFIYWQF